MALRTDLETNHSFGEIIGKTKKMQHLFTQIQTAAVSSITVLIQDTITASEKQVPSLPSIVLQYQPN